jgi:hypothetical protein
VFPTKCFLNGGHVLDGTFVPFYPVKSPPLPDQLIHPYMRCVLMTVTVWMWNVSYRLLC